MELNHFQIELPDKFKEPKPRGLSLVVTNGLVLGLKVAISGVTSIGLNTMDDI